MSKEKSDAFLRAAARRAVPISKVNMVDLKFSIEQGIRDLMYHEFKFKEDHRFMDVYLALGYIASISSISASAYSYTHPFEELLTKQILVVGIFIYFVCTSISAIYQWKVKGNIVWRGTRTVESQVPCTYQNQFLSVHLITNKYSPEVKLEFETTDSKKVPLTVNVGAWFTNKGEFVAAKFRDDVKPVIDGLSKKTE